MNVDHVKRVRIIAEGLQSVAEQCKVGEFQKSMWERANWAREAAAEIDRLRGVLAEAHRHLKLALTDGTTTHTGVAEGILSAALAEGNGQEGGA